MILLIKGGLTTYSLHACRQQLSSPTSADHQGIIFGPRIRGKWTVCGPKVCGPNFSGHLRLPDFPDSKNQSSFHFTSLRDSDRGDFRA